jgi:hypothetical protein
LRVNTRRIEGQIGLEAVGEDILSDRDGDRAAERVEEDRDRISCGPTRILVWLSADDFRTAALQTCLESLVSGALSLEMYLQGVGSADEKEVKVKKVRTCLSCRGQLEQL